MAQMPPPPQGPPGGYPPAPGQYPPPMGPQGGYPPPGYQQYPQQFAGGPVGPGGRPLAGIGERFVALLVDGIIVGIPSFVISLVIGAATTSCSTDAFGYRTCTAGGGVLFAYLIIALIGLGYYTFMFMRGQTIGMKLFNIYVVDQQTGRAPETGKAVLRAIGYYLNSIVCGLPIGWIWAFFNPQKQGWHDLIAGTMVVK